MLQGRSGVVFEIFFPEFENYFEAGFWGSKFATFFPRDSRWKKCQL
jgi:hypothetical protein